MIFGQDTTEIHIIQSCVPPGIQFCVPTGIQNYLTKEPLLVSSVSYIRLLSLSNTLPTLPNTANSISARSAMDFSKYHSASETDEDADEEPFDICGEMGMSDDDDGDDDCNELEDSIGAPIDMSGGGGGGGGEEAEGEGRCHLAVTASSTTAVAGTGVDISGSVSQGRWLDLSNRIPTNVDHEYEHMYENMSKDAPNIHGIHHLPRVTT